ncbi:ERF family protein [Stappia indica]|uniref:ERF family protein n=1 Tax=Stappia indica TaxID=538381 RepID=UPI001CD46B83|nr:ERF family protein [Stappia indica]MCA1298002.1 ERF family protein [Stappia indica]
MPRDSGALQTGAHGAVMTPADMLAHAVTNGAGLEVVEKLMSLQDRWEANQARKAFDDAMARMREKMPRVVKDKKVDFSTAKGRTNYQYEDLDSVTSAISPVMAELGLSFRWRTDNSASGVKVSCIISHRGGHYEETSLSAPVDASGNKNTIQAIGSAITYLQRYTLKAALGLAAGVDDDGHGGRDNRADDQADQKCPQQRPGPASKANSRETYARLSKANAGLDSVEKHAKFWSQKSAQAAFASLPDDWKQSLGQERDRKLSELKAQVVPADTGPINPDEFLADLEAELAQAADADAVAAIWSARAPEDALDFPPDLDRAQALRDAAMQRVGGV